MEKLSSTYGYLNITKINELPNTVRLEMAVGVTSPISGKRYKSNFEKELGTYQLPVSNDNIKDIIKFLKKNAISCHIKDSKNLCKNNLVINYNDLIFIINDTQNYDLFLYELDF